MQDTKLLSLARLISDWPGIVARPDLALIEDCLVLIDHLGDARTVVDVGSGAGLPGLPLKIARPELELTLIEADHDKAAFLVHACATLGLAGVEVVARRAEEAGHDPRYREAFDAAVARALAHGGFVVDIERGAVLACKLDEVATAHLHVAGGVDPVREREEQVRALVRAGAAGAARASAAAAGAFSAPEVQGGR